MAHQFAGFRLATLLDAVCPEDLCVVPEPAMQLGPRTEFVPDLAVVRLDQMSGTKLTEPPLLAVEVRSSATALIDPNRKKAAYEQFGVQSYWVVDPDSARTELTVFELRDGHYETEAKAVTPVTLSSPFDVTVDPAGLTRKLRR
jgi:Uma2 family endonuclease